MIAHATPYPRRLASTVLAGAVVLSGGGVGSGGPGGTHATPSAATEQEWRSLASERPAPLEGAPRVTISEVVLTGAYDWNAPGTVTPALGIAEIAAAGLLRRRDVDFVERRRFAAAAEAEREGRARRPGQPPAGVSRSVDFSATAVWLPTASTSSVEVRLTRLETGDVVGATRVSLEGQPDPVTLARALVAGIVEVLDDLGRRPAWTDPMTAGVNATAPSRVSDQAQRAFFQGLASEERWNWEGARRGYQSASADQGFHEAVAALARAARLRLGGTLAAS